MTVSVDLYFPVYLIDKVATVYLIDKVASVDTKGSICLFLSIFFSVAGGKNPGSSFIDRVSLVA